MNQSNVATLRRNGFKVRVLNERRLKGTDTLIPRSQFSEFGKYPTDQMSHTGGRITVEITSPDGITRSGRSDCSTKDSFDHSVGLRIALGRAIAEFPGEQ